MPLSTDPRTLALQAQTNGVIFPLVSQPKADIANARSQASFETNEMAALLAGSAAILDKRRKHLEALKAEPIFSKVGIHDMSREERVERALAMAFKLVEVTTQVIDSDNPEEDGSYLRACIGESLSLDLHFGMYMTTIMSQGTSDQVNKWLPPAAQFVHIGTYAQTELGHGTYLRGLETTATYDKVTEEFVVHSPTMSAVKWWPGCLAKVCNHCVLMARLFIDGTDYGPHPFMLQIRRLDTHECMPGIELSDIGPKFGFNGVDNGTMRLTYVRIPRTNMLMKNSQVSREGFYTAPSVKKANYGAMVKVRSFIVSSAADSLSKAATIAARYCTVRRQTAFDEGQSEAQVINFPHVQHKLFPIIATAYALHFTGNEMKLVHKKFEQMSRSRSDFSSLPALHASSSGLKAYTTSVTSDSIEACRRLMGGHGYSMNAGLASMFATYVAAVTYEGDNNIMYLQTARYLFKNWHSNRTSAIKPLDARWLVGAVSFNPSHPEYSEKLLELLQKHCDLLVDTTGKLTLRRASECSDIDIACPPNLARHVLPITQKPLAAWDAAGASPAENVDAADSAFPVPVAVWSRLDHLWIQAAHQHCIVVVAGNFMAGVRASAGTASAAVREVLQRLITCYLSKHAIESATGLDRMIAQLQLCCSCAVRPDFHLTALALAGLLPTSSVTEITALHSSSIQALAPDVVSLVDAFDHDDFTLDSAVGTSICPC